MGVKAFDSGHLAGASPAIFQELRGGRRGYSEAMRLAWLLAVLPGCYFDRSGVGGASPSDAAGDDVDAAATSDAPDPTLDADPAAPDAMVVTPIGCPAGYTISGDPALPHRYRFDDSSNRTRTDAIADCADDSVGLTYLAISDSAEENSYLDTISAARAVWLGISDAAAEGTWVTQIGGVQTYLSWDTGQPDNFFNEDFAVINDGGKWNDVGGSGNQRYVCECDPGSTTF